MHQLQFRTHKDPSISAENWSHENEQTHTTEAGGAAPLAFLCQLAQSLNPWIRTKSVIKNKVPQNSNPGLVMWEVIIIFCCNLLHLEEEEREWVFGCPESGVFQPSHSDLIAQPLPEVTCYCLWASEVQPNEMYLNAFRYSTDFWCKFCLTVIIWKAVDCCLQSELFCVISEVVGSPQWDTLSTLSIAKTPAHYI